MTYLIEKLVTFSLFVITLSTLSSAYADGGYMYCMDATTTNRWPMDSPAWKWAHGNNNWPDWLVAEGGYPYNGYIWFNGPAGANGTARVVLWGQKITAEEAYRRCADLIKICTDEYGPNYHLIGSSDSTNSLGWLNIYMPSTTHSCPGWRPYDPYAPIIGPF